MLRKLNLPHDFAERCRSQISRHERQTATTLGPTKCSRTFFSVELGHMLTLRAKT